MSIVTRNELRTMLSKSMPRLRKPSRLPSDDDSLRVQQSLAQQAKESLKKLGTPSGTSTASTGTRQGGRTWDYSWNGGRPTARIFATGETISLPASVGEHEARAYLAKRGIKV